MFDFNKVAPVHLARGAHVTAEDGLCFMEMVAWFAGEKHNDAPSCVSPVLTVFGIGLNDLMNDTERNTLLKPLVPLIAGTVDPDSEQKRAEFLIMWTVNNIVPVALINDIDRLSSLVPLVRACEASNTTDEAKNAVFQLHAFDCPRHFYNAIQMFNGNMNSNAMSLLTKGINVGVYQASNPRIWELAIEGLRQAILLGRHEGFVDEADVLSQRSDKLLELVP